MTGTMKYRQCSTLFFVFQKGDEMMKTYVCKRLRLCRYLMECGFEPYKIVPDRDNPRYNVWLFDHSKDLMAAVMRYLTRNEVQQQN